MVICVCVLYNAALDECPERTKLYIITIIIIDRFPFSAASPFSMLILPDIWYQSEQCMFVTIIKMEFKFFLSILISFSLVCFTSDCHFHILYIYIYIYMYPSNE